MHISIHHQHFHSPGPKQHWPSSVASSSLSTSVRNSNSCSLPRDAVNFIHSNPMSLRLNMPGTSQPADDQSSRHPEGICRVRMSHIASYYAASSNPHPSYPRLEESV